MNGLYEDMKKLIIDSRMRNVEKSRLMSLGYELIELEKSMDVYDEISAHPDIFCAKIGGLGALGVSTIVAEPSRFEKIYSRITQNDSSDDLIKVVKGEETIRYSYPDDIKYNVCVFGEYAVHNFKYTDEKVLELIDANNFKKISVNQGYTNCSIAVIDDRSIITEDVGIYNKLKKNDLDILLIEKEDIKLPGKEWTGNSDYELDYYSSKKGFIGGTISRIDNYVVITGDIKKFKSFEKIKSFIEERKLTIIDFPGYELLDYGGIIG